MTLRRSARTHIWPLLLLLLAALFMRAAVPQGYMISSEAPGSLSITVCGSDLFWQKMAKQQPAPVSMDSMHGMHGSQHAGMDDGGHGASHGDGHDSEHGDSAPCAFAGFAGPASPPDLADDLPLPAPAVLAFAADREVLRLVAIPRALPPSRAPPLPA